MSELEKEELFTRIKGMTFEEKALAVTAIPSGILFNELRRREMTGDRMLKDISSILKGQGA